MLEHKLIFKRLCSAIVPAFEEVQAVKDVIKVKKPKKSKYNV